MTPLPRIMVAPNGARRTPTEHSAVPVTVADTVATAAACHTEGAGGIHAHVRDADGAHVLDAGLYRELLSEMAQAVPEMAVQITTEAAGRYTPAEQAALVAELRPEAVSVALREMTADPDVAARFYRDAAADGVTVQHILYEPEELPQLTGFVAAGVVPEPLQLLYVLGAYQPARDGTLADLGRFVAEAASSGLVADWAACAFGGRETACLCAAAAAGGKVRVGFENNLLNSDGRPAANNAERVAEVRAALDQQAPGT